MNKIQNILLLRTKQSNPFTHVLYALHSFVFYNRIHIYVPVLLLSLFIHPKKHKKGLNYSKKAPAMEGPPHHFILLSYENSLYFLVKLMNTYNTLQYAKSTSATTFYTSSTQRSIYFIHSDSRQYLKNKRIVFTQAHVKKISGYIMTQDGAQFVFNNNYKYILFLNSVFLLVNLFP